MVSRALRCRPSVLGFGLVLTPLATANASTPVPVPAFPNTCDLQSDPDCSEDVAVTHDPTVNEVCIRDVTLVVDDPAFLEVEPPLAVEDLVCDFHVAFPSTNCEWDDAGAPFPATFHAHGVGHMYTGYDYVLEHLAANRIVAVSLRSYLGAPSSFQANGARFAACIRAILDPDPARVDSTGADPWALADAARLDPTNIGLSSHSQGGANLFYAARALADLRDAGLGEETPQAAVLIAPLSPLGEPALDGFTVEYRDLPALLVVDASQENQQPYNAQPYYDHAGSEGTVSGNPDVTTRALMHLWGGIHNAFDTTRSESRPEEQTAFRGLAQAMFGWQLQGREEFKRDVTLERVGPTLESLNDFNHPRWFRAYSQFSQGTRTAADGATGQDRRTMVVANFEDGSEQQGFMANPGDLDVDRTGAPFNSLEALNIGLGLVGGKTPDLGTATQQECEEQLAPNPDESCQWYARHHRTGPYPFFILGPPATSRP